TQNPEISASALALLKFCSRLTTPKTSSTSDLSVVRCTPPPSNCPPSIQGSTDQISHSGSKKKRKQRTPISFKLRYSHARAIRSSKENTKSPI
ncbi:hypothetical protein AVEN_235714-1, partial [Araneus ventricosus]